jgi:hypothetical protein
VTGHSFGWRSGTKYEKNIDKNFLTAKAQERQNLELKTETIRSSFRRSLLLAISGNRLRAQRRASSQSLDGFGRERQER